MTDEELLYELAEAYGEGLVISMDLELCYWCESPLNPETWECTNNCDPSEKIAELLKERLPAELAKLGLKEKAENESDLSKE